MAYVPGPAHDLFLSYAHEDAEWVNALQEQLTEKLLHRLGWNCEVWQDLNELRTGQNWPGELEKAVRASAAFLAVVSRNYPTGWCEKELDTFIRECRERDELEAGGFGRVLKVIKFPWRDNAHLGFHSEYQHVDFFSRDAKTGEEREFRPTSEPFRKALATLSFHIEKLFEAMLLRREKVFVARGATDVSERREAIIRQIRAEGYAISPSPQGYIPNGMDRPTLQHFIEPARTTVHVLGRGYDPCIREQIDLAREAEKRLVFVLLPEHNSGDEKHKMLIDDIRNNRLDLPDGCWNLLESRSMASLTEDLIGLLKPAQPIAAPATSGGARVYLLCDPNTPEDAGFAREIQASIREREKMQVELPVVDSSSPSLQHERLLSECDGLLLYKEKAPRNWYARNCGDLVMAELRERTRELRSKALLVVSANEVYPQGVTVIQRHDPFDLGQLELFLAPLRGMNPAQGVAHAIN